MLAARSGANIIWTPNMYISKDKLNQIESVRFVPYKDKTGYGLSFHYYSILEVVYKPTWRNLWFGWTENNYYACERSNGEITYSEQGLRDYQELLEKLEKIK